MQLDPVFLPDDWTPEQAVAVAEFLVALHDAIWDHYGWAFARESSGPPSSSSPVPAQLVLPFADAGNLV